MGAGKHKRRRKVSVKRHHRGAGKGEGFREKYTYFEIPENKRRGQSLRKVLKNK